jgi:hypothetical protein
MSKSSGNFFAYKCQCSDESGSLDMFSAIAGQSLQNLVELARNLISVEKRNQSLDYVLEFATLAEAQAATGLVAGTIVLV